MVAAKSSTERAAEARARLKAQGGKETLIRFDPEATRALASITGRTGEGQSEAVCRAVKKLNVEEECPTKA